MSEYHSAVEALDKINISKEENKTKGKLFVIIMFSTKERVFSTTLHWKT